MSKFGYIVKDYLLKNHIQQKTISENSELSSSSVSQMLKSENIGLNNMIAIADALGCDLDIVLVPRNQNQS